jgi:hypothetical protein
MNRLLKDQEVTFIIFGVQARRLTRMALFCMHQLLFRYKPFGTGWYTFAVLIVFAAGPCDQEVC